MLNLNFIALFPNNRDQRFSSRAGGGVVERNVALGVWRKQPLGDLVPPDPKGHFAHVITVSLMF